MAPKSAAISTLPGAAQTVARAMSPSTVSGLPILAQPRAIPRPHDIDGCERDVALVLLEILQLRPASAPAPWAAAIHPQRAAHAIVGFAGVGEDAFVLTDGGAGAVAPQLEHRAGLLVRFGGEHGADGTAADAGHGVAALDGIGEDLPIWSTEVIAPSVRSCSAVLMRVALVDRHVARGGGQFAIGANATPIDDGVEDLDSGARSRSAA